MKTLTRWYKKKFVRISFYGIVVPFVLFLLIDLFFPFRFKEDFSTIITASDGTVINAFLNKEDKWRMKTELKEITPLLRNTIINKEDKYFYYHPGVNPVAIGRALFNNTAKGRKTSGASTITMQVVRLLEPRRRTYFNKLVEMFRAFQLEWHYSKDEILQMYLNHVPYGSNIEGVKAASVIYFRQNPDYLSLAQVVTLAIIPNRPSSLVLGKSNDEIVKQRNKWLERFKEDKLFPTQDIEDALAEPLVAKRYPVPQLAPHLAYRLLKMYPRQPIIHSGLIRSKQEQVQNMTFNYIQRMHTRNISNAAVLVINNHTGMVEAYIGSADFYDVDNGGQVDGVQAMRSPGSALKPFLYALAFDKGYVTPKTVLLDVPDDYKGYAPKNYDDKFRGSVTTEFALSNSLNVPAVELLNEVGVEVFTDRMAMAGFSDVKKRKQKLGLSVILGGCGVKLEELTRLYTSFANAGKMKTLRWTNDTTHLVETQLITPEASYLVNNTLTQLVRPDLPVNYQSSYHLPKIAWKTGTSYGRRDAWSVGYNADYTIGVWAGNFDGTGAPDLSGAEIATPLLFEIFNSIAYNTNSNWFRPTKGLDIRLVCSESGLPASDSCKNLVMDYFIPGISSNQKCNHTKEVYMSANESICYCKDCLPESGYKVKLMPNLAPELIAYYDAENIPYKKLPEHNPACTKISKGQGPRIMHPADDAEYIFEKDGSRELMLACNAAADTKTVYWYVNDVFYKKGTPTDKIFYKPAKAGSYKVSCADDRGRNTNVYIQVTML